MSASPTPSTCCSEVKKERSKVEKERPLDTQLLLFIKGNAVILAFRGSEPINFFDWFYNFLLATSKNGCSYAAMGTLTPREMDGYGADAHTDARVHKQFDQDHGM